MRHIDRVGFIGLLCSPIPSIKPEDDVFKPLHDLIPAPLDRKRLLDLRVIMDAACDRLAEKPTPLAQRRKHRVFDGMTRFLATLFLPLFPLILRTSVWSLGRIDQEVLEAFKRGLEVFDP